jgi:hypothetical protein
MADNSDGAVKDHIWMIGGSHADRVKILQGVTGLTPTFSPSPFNQMSSSRFEINTKYYQAEVHFLSGSFDLEETSFTEDLAIKHRNLVPSLENRVDALVVIHDEAGEAEHARRLESFLESVVDTLDPGISVYIAKDEDSLSPATSSWCYDNGFEIVSLTEPEVDEEETFKEKTGLARVMEALESHMWSNMVYKTDLRPQAEASAPEKDEAMPEDDLSDMPPEVMSSFADVLKFMKGEDSSIDNASNSKGDSNDEMDFLGPLQKLRGQLSGLDDEKRRKMASQVAMALMSALGDDDDEDLI